MLVGLSEFSSFKTAANAQEVHLLNDVKQLNALVPKLLACDNWVVLGEGSNVLFVGDYMGIVVINRLKGIQFDMEQIELAAKNTVLVTAAAGENWHQFVLQMSQADCYGLENLAFIPGSVGAAPVQNIGAYGVEVENFIHSVTVFDLLTQSTKVLAANDCGFSYRDSHFKSEAWRSRYIITAVTFELQKKFNPVLTYQGLQSQESIENSASLIERVIQVRQSKLPDPKILPNAGSFFKNPIIKRNQLMSLQAKYSQIPFFEVDEEHVKIPAAWLLQSCGYKGKITSSGAGVYEHHALILVNHGGASGKAIWSLATEMIKAVSSLFDITLSPEVRILPPQSKEA